MTSLGGVGNQSRGGSLLSIGTGHLVLQVPGERGAAGAFCQLVELVAARRGRASVPRVLSDGRVTRAGASVDVPCVQALHGLF